MLVPGKRRVYFERGGKQHINGLGYQVHSGPVQLVFQDWYEEVGSRFAYPPCFETFNAVHGETPRSSSALEQSLGTHRATLPRDPRRGR